MKTYDQNPELLNARWQTDIILAITQQQISNFPKLCMKMQNLRLMRVQHDLCPLQTTNILLTHSALHGQLITSVIIKSGYQWQFSLNAFKYWPSSALS